MADVIKTRIKNITKEQKELLIAQLELDLDLANGRFSGVEGRLDMKKKWSAIANILNAVGGAVKSQEKWQNAWDDMKKYARKQWAILKEHKNRTGLGYENILKRPTPLSAIDQRILNIISEESVAGCSQVQELGLELINETPHSTPLSNEPECDGPQTPETVRHPVRRIRGSAYTRDKILKEANDIEKSKVLALNKIADAMVTKNEIKLKIASALEEHNLILKQLFVPKPAVKTQPTEYNEEYLDEENLL